MTGVLALLTVLMSYRHIFKLLKVAVVFILFSAACRAPETSAPQNAVSQTDTTVTPADLTPTATTIVITPRSSSTVTLTATHTPQPATSTATAVASARPSPTPDFPIYGGAPLRRDQIGVQIHIHREDMRPILRHLRALGVGWVKVQVSWKLYEPQADGYAADRFAELDQLVESAVNNEMRVLLNVSKAPEWSRSTTELDGPPVDYTHYRDFMAYLAGRYKGRVAAYELWNEPNLQREWNGAPLDASALVALIAAGAEGARQADPAVILISAAPATTGINDGITAIDDRLFLRGMVEGGIDTVVDGIGVHPYGWANPPDSNHTAPDPSVPSHNNHPSFFFADTLADYKAILAEYDVEKPLWVTEFGWGSFDMIVDDDHDLAPPPPGAEFMADVSEWDQALYIMRALEMGQQDGTVGPMFLWNLNFGPLLGHEYSESGYSILRPDGSRRPAYRSLEHAKKA